MFKSINWDNIFTWFVDLTLYDILFYLALILVLFFPQVAICFAILSLRNLVHKDYMEFDREIVEVKLAEKQ